MKKPKRLIRYWDANVFLAYFNKEDDRIAMCKAIIEKAQTGELIIATSAVTLSEVVHIKGKDRIDPANRETIGKFFENDLIHLINCDQFIGKKAQELMWDHNVSHKDAIHLASAIIKGITTIDTYDRNDFEQFDQKFGNPPIRIGPPNLPFQEKLFE